MVNSLTAAITLSLLIFALSPLATAQFITDFQGKPLVNGGNYSISRNNPGPDEGSLSWLNKTNSCPLYIVQGVIDVVEPPPSHEFKPPAISYVTLRSPLKSRLLPLSATFDITFNDKNTPCKNRPLKWSVKPVGSIKNAFHLVAGCEINPHFDTGSFKVVATTDEFGSKNLFNLEFCFPVQQKKQCFKVGEFPNDSIFGITTDPKIKHFPTTLAFSPPPPSV